MSDFDFDSALQAQVERQIGGTPPAEVTEDPIIDKYGEPGEDPVVDDDDVVVEDDVDDDVEDDDVVVEEEDDDDDDPVVPQFDEETQAFIDRYGGLEKALKAGVEGQRMVGRQGQELGELRKLVEGIQERMDAPAPAPIAAPGQFEEQIEEDPASVAVWAFDNGQEAVYNEAMEAWMQVDPLQASRFERALEIEQIKAELVAQQQAPAAPDQTEIISALSEKYADFSDVVSTATPEELDGLDRGVIEELEARNPTAAFEMVYRWVKSNRTTSAPPATAAAAKRAAEATRTAKREAAAVARGTSKPAGGDNSTMDQLRESMLSPDPFNVQQGLRDSAG